jgi:CheY-like chemotaxis protein
LTLTRALTDRGYDVRTAADGQAAITILKGLGTLPAIAITDLQMTGGSGEELARVLARRYPDLPVIFMTAYLARYRTAYLPGPILEKPFRADQLCELLGSVLTAASELRAYGKSTAGHSLGRRRQASASDALSATAKPE